MSSLTFIQLYGEVPGEVYGEVSRVRDRLSWTQSPTQYRDRAHGSGSSGPLSFQNTHTLAARLPSLVGVSYNTHTAEDTSHSS